MQQPICCRTIFQPVSLFSSILMQNHSTNTTFIIKTIFEQIIKIKPTDLNIKCKGMETLKAKA